MTRLFSKSLASGGVFLLVLSCAVENRKGSPSTGTREWRVYGGDLAANRYSALNQINQSNVGRLKVAWVHHTGEKRYDVSGTIVRNPHTTAEDVTVGRKLFRAHCAKCHGEQGTGGAGAFGSDLMRKQLKYGNSDGVLFRTIFEGVPSGGMPGTYASEKQVWQLVTFLRSLRGENAREAQPESRGKTQYGWGVGARWATIECTPIVVDGVMYVTTLFSKVTALNAATGQEIWTFDLYQDGRFRGYNRGVMYWEQAGEKRMYATAGDRLYALDASTGKLLPQFGDKGSVDLTRGFDREVNFITITSPGIIYKNLLIVGSSTYAGFGGDLAGGGVKHAPGHIRAFDVHTGKQVWIFYTIPRPGQFGYDTWPPNAWKTAYGANSWGGLVLDEHRGLVFAGTAAPYYAPPRYGQNLFGNTILALKADTGERVWHFQVIHHDVWDLDIPCQPNLVTVRHEGREIEALAQVGKVGMVFLFDRETGTPLFPVEERPVPTDTDLEGEKSWPTQPFPVKPPPYVRHTLTEDDVTNISSEARAFVLEQLKRYRHGGPYPPPVKRGTVISPGIHGGNNWGGASFDPISGWLYVNSNEVPWLFGPPFTNRFEDNRGYPAVRPPWGKLNAIDLNRGEIVWQVPLGEFRELTAEGVPTTGTENLGGCIVTEGGLVFVGATKDGKFRAFNKRNGELLWETQLPAVAYATPSTYEAKGKQYVVIAVGGGGGMQSDYVFEDAAGYQAHRRFGTSDAFVAFALP